MLSAFRQMPKTSFYKMIKTISTSTSGTPRIVGHWMAGCAGMCLGAVILGGVTRLTESGLSMVDWKLFGRRPPQGHDEWTQEFEKYRLSPEYIYKNTNITIEEFKWIWYMEYGHRMWGRVIGAVFYIPAGLFWYKGYFDKALKKRVGAIGILLAGQGLLGWYMVKSGLDPLAFEGPNDTPRVSQYRLASHLSGAMILYSLLFWNACSILKSPSLLSQKFIPKSHLNFRKLAMGSKALVFLTAVSGAFVAGLDAGLIYNTFPLMAGKIIPDDLLSFSPWFKNLTENPTTVQFNHRILGVSTYTFIVLMMIYKTYRVKGLPRGANSALLALLIAIHAQVSLGIATLLTYVPTPLAAAHQSGALVTLSMALWLSHELKFMKALKVLPK